MAAADTSAGDSRAAMQDWRTFPEFLQERHWVILRSREERQLKKVDVLARYLVDMGLRHPSERTQTTVASLVSHVSGQHNDEDFSKLSTLLQTVKSVLKTHMTRAKQVGAPVFTNNLLTLPATVAELPAAMRNHFFPAGAFAPPMDMIPIHASAAIWPCRSTNRQAGLNRQVSGGADLVVAVPASVTMAAQQAALQTAAAFTAMSRTSGGGLELPGLEITPAGQRLIANAQGRASSLGALLDRAEAQVVPGTAPQSVAADTCGGSGSTAAPALALENGTPAPPLVAESKTSVVAAAPTQIPVEPATVQEQVPVSEADAAQADLEKRVLGLAQSHYGATLSELPALDETDNGESKKRPAARNQAAKRGRPAASALTVKKEIGKTVGVQKKPSVKAKPLKKPAACVKPTAEKCAAAKTLKVLSRKEALKQRPKGCGRCRQTPGCCPSCWTQRGYRVLL